MRYLSTVDKFVSGWFGGCGGDINHTITDIGSDLQKAVRGVAGLQTEISSSAADLIGFATRRQREVHERTWGLL